MADISLVSVEGAAAAPWLDPQTSERPSRLNPADGFGHLRLLGVMPTKIVAVFARIDGGVDYDAPPFSAWLVEAPGAKANWPAVTADGAGNRRGFTPNAPGHYTLVVRHDAGGSMVIHFDVT